MKRYVAKKRHKVIYILCARVHSCTRACVYFLTKNFMKIFLKSIYIEMYVTFIFHIEKRVKTCPRSRSVPHWV